MKNHEIRITKTSEIKHHPKDMKVDANMVDADTLKQVSPTNLHVLEVSPQVLGIANNVLEIQSLEPKVSKVQVLELQVLDIKTSEVEVSNIKLPKDHVLNIHVLNIQICMSRISKFTFRFSKKQLSFMFWRT